MRGAPPGEFRCGQGLSIVNQNVFSGMGYKGPARERVNPEMAMDRNAPNAKGLQIPREAQNDGLRGTGAQTPSQVLP